MTGPIIERHSRHIAMTAMADFILLGHEAVGSFALADSKTDLFGVALGGLFTSESMFHRRTDAGNAALVAAAAMLAVTALLWPVLNVIGLIAGVMVYAVVLIALRPLSEAETTMLQNMLPPRLTQSRVGRYVLGGAA